MEAIALALFIVGYLFITLEAKTGVNKSAVALAMGALLWSLVSLVEGAATRPHLAEAGADIFEIVVFLLAAMSLVEILVHYKLFDVIRGKLYKYKFSERQQFVLIATVTFFLSAILDNLTTTIVMIQIARKFFRNDNLAVAVAGIVIAANAGGAFSPIGDVTTIMIWLADKFTASEILAIGFLPSLTLLGTALLFMTRKIKGDTQDEPGEVVASLSSSEKLVVVTTLLTFALPLVANYVGLPPYIGLLLGLGIVWILVDLMKHISRRPTHLEASIEELVRKTDIPAIKFFIGILLAVSALSALGVLSHISGALYGETQTAGSVISGNVALGLLSAILDNVPLTAIAISMLSISSSFLWVLLALSVGTGGSLLIIGSAAGVVASGMIKELTFGRYFKIAFVPALAGFLAALGVWWIEYAVFAA